MALDLASEAVTNNKAASGLTLASVPALWQAQHCGSQPQDKWSDVVQRIEQPHVLSPWHC